MNYKINPKNGDKLSILGFGCMRFGGDSLTSSFAGGFDTKKAEQLIKSAIDSGVNYFDTAYVYNGSEEVLGKTLAKCGVRDKVYIATKMPLILCRSRNDLDKSFAKHLERLQTDYIDYYPVSYTHLDVYKRQLLQRQSQPIFERRWKTAGKYQTGGPG